jgi:hypothetical protein
VLDAASDFRRARRAAFLARIARIFRRRRPRGAGPQTLPKTAGPPTGASRLEVIALAAIVGTLEPTRHFDARFRPISELVRPRWERVALAHRKGTPLPPITVVSRPDGYYEVDGRHRVSVALALGHPDIDAWVTRAANVAG